MCGIAGFWGSPGEGDGARQVLERMTGAIQHRGPDDEGFWLDPGPAIALGHRRLSIIDLSAAGHQPMCSVSGRYVIAFNGEIYNFPDLRAAEEARSVRFRGHSDTEVMLAVIERVGVVDATRSFVGMFAFALWDRGEQELHLVRDRLGEKPLYYGWAGGTLLFGSELKGLRAHPAWENRVDRGALSAFMRYGYVPGPHSIHEGVRKVAPGGIVTIGAAGRGPARETEYWSARESMERGLANPAREADSDLVTRFDGLLRRTVRQEMVADVPLGAFLSGGVDSSLVVALMQVESPRPIRTFTIGFEEAGFDEAPFARRVANHLGTEHTELYVTPAEARAVIPALPTLYDEPFADPSQIPTFLVSRLARRAVTVSLSGDGGDELFGGYVRYAMTRRLWSLLRLLPMWVRRGTSRLFARSARPHTGLAELLARAAFRGRWSRDRGDRLAAVVAAGDVDQVYRAILSHWQNPSDVVLGGTEPIMLPAESRGWPRVPGLDQRMMYADTVSYLPDDVLVKVDRAAMAVSLETRAPFLDHRIAEEAWRVPLNRHLRDGRGKWLLRSVLSRYLPTDMIDRPKMGFSVPIGAWLRGPLREWGADLLSVSRVRRQGWFDATALWRRWEQHQTGQWTWQHSLWNALMFQAWLDSQDRGGAGMVVAGSAQVPHGGAAASDPRAVH